MNIGKVADNFIITSKYLPANRPDHFGVDLSVGINAPIKNIYDGVVTVAVKGCYEGNFACGYGGGNWVEIDHKNGFKTRYLHFTENYVNVGQEVKKGDIIGLQGNTGYSYGSHLHFELWENGIRINPEPYLLLQKDFPSQPKKSKLNLILFIIFLIVVIILAYIKREKLKEIKNNTEKWIIQKWQAVSS